MAHKTIIELFGENELAISKLYGIYSKNLPKHKAFWTRLSEEEIGHAEHIAGMCKITGIEPDFTGTVLGSESRLSQHSLRLVIKNDKKCFEPNKFARNIIKYINNFVKQQIEEAKKKNLTHIEAINVALRVERSAIENKNFEIFVPNNMLVKDLLKKMNRETSQHIKVLTKELKKQ